MFRRDMMSVSNFLVYQSPASTLSRDRSHAKLSLAEIDQRKHLLPSSSFNITSPARVAVVLEEEAEAHDTSGGDQPVMTEKQRLQRRMMELEAEYLDLQQKLRLLEDPSPSATSTTSATCESPL